MTDWKPDICIYHGGCDDGFGAAWSVWRKWPDVQFVPGVYGKLPPVETRGKNILMVDFSYKRDVLEKLPFNNLVILDHHKTAEQEIRPWAGCSMKALREGAELICAQAATETGHPIAAHFDMNTSGAVMAWDFCFTIPHNDPPPNMLALIQDRDLWRFAFGDRTKEFSAALRTYPMDFAVWDAIAADPDKLIADGKIILRAHQFNVNKFCEEAFTERISGYDVPCVNVPYHYASDVAHELLQRNPEAPFAAAWFKRGDGLFQASLRSENHRVDVSEIAKKHGGGGHRNAAGFQIPSMKDSPTP